MCAESRHRYYTPSGEMLYWVATSKLADHELPTNPLFVVATIFEAITSVLCLELVIYGLALNVNPRYRRLPTVQPEEPGG